MQLASTCLLKLKNLMAFRERLVKTNVGLKDAIKNLKNMGELIDNTFIVNQSEQHQKLIEKQIIDMDKQIEVTLKEDYQIKNT
jgi:hypothetical protein